MAALTAMVRVHEGSDGDGEGSDSDGEGSDSDSEGSDSDGEGSDGDSKGSDSDGEGSDGDSENDVAVIWQIRAAVRAAARVWAMRAVTLNQGSSSSDDTTAGSGT